jgi:glycosyltransferase involved in cell wall biosynthesis
MASGSLPISSPETTAERLGGASKSRQKTNGLEPEERDDLVVLEELGIGFEDSQLRRTGLNPLRDFSGIKILRRSFKKHAPSVLFLYGAKPVIYASLTAPKNSNLRVFSMVTGLGFLFLQTGLKGRLLTCLASIAYRLALRRNTLVFFHNKDDRDLFVSRGLCPQHKTRVIGGSGVDLAYYRPRPETAISFDFIFIGRLLADKGVREFLRALDLLRSWGLTPRALVLGERDSNPTSLSASEVAEWQARGTAEFRGQVKDVRPYLAASSVLVLPSYREGMPRSVLEAMAMGKAVVATDVPGCRQAVTHAINGLLVPPGDERKLAEAMETLLGAKDRAQEMGAQGLTIARQKFDVNIVTADLLSQMEL